jgi:hypothetical protein
MAQKPPQTAAAGRSPFASHASSNFHNITHFPKTGSHYCRHRWRNFERLMDADSGPFYWNQRSATLVVKAPAFEITALLRIMEVPMTIQGDHHTNDAENDVDATMKAVGVVIVLVVIASMALWYI